MQSAQTSMDSIIAPYIVTQPIPTYISGCSRYLSMQLLVLYRDGLCVTM